MKETFDYFERYRIPALFLVVGLLVIFGIFSNNSSKGQLSVAPSNAMCLQRGGCPNQMANGPLAGSNVPPGYGQPYGYNPQMMAQQNCLMNPSLPGCPRMSAQMPSQQVAFQSNTLTLDIGVTLAGRGDVVSVQPGSAADRAGLQVGDRINRINGA